tara:strand:+ start:1923 stop:2102 length:180 start_codon:yes stop_codon:yes gene_type:complete
MITYFALNRAVYRSPIKDLSFDYEIKNGFPNAAFLMSSNKQAFDEALRLNTHNSSKEEN